MLRSGVRQCSIKSFMMRAEKLVPYEICLAGVLKLMWGILWPCTLIFNVQKGRSKPQIDLDQEEFNEKNCADLQKMTVSSSSYLERTQNTTDNEETAL